VKRFLGKVKISEQANQRCKDTARLTTIDRLKPVPRVFQRILMHSFTSFGKPVSEA
jgi:hypothetical protein